MTPWIVGAVLGFLGYHLVLVGALRHRRRQAMRVVIQDPCSNVEEGSWLWYLLGCFWEDLLP